MKDPIALSSRLKEMWAESTYDDIGMCILIDGFIAYIVGTFCCAVCKGNKAVRVITTIMTFVGCVLCRITFMQPDGSFPILHAITTICMVPAIILTLVILLCIAGFNALK